MRLLCHGSSGPHQTSWLDRIFLYQRHKALIYELFINYDYDVLHTVVEYCSLTAYTGHGGGVMTISVVTTLNSCSFTVDKSKPKASSWQQTPQQPTTLPSQANRPPDVVPGSATSAQRRCQGIQQLKGLLAASNCRFEAFAVVLQHWMAKVCTWLLLISECCWLGNTYIQTKYQWLQFFLPSTLNILSLETYLMQTQCLLQ